MGIVRRAPATSALVVVLVAVFAYQWVSNGRGYDYLIGTGRIPDVMLAWGVLPGRIRAGEYYRLVTAGFLHASLVHIALNLWGLLYAGPYVERWYGPVRSSAVYLAAVILGDIVAAATSTDRTVTIGASGGIVGLFAAIVVVGVKFWSQREEIARGAVPLVATLANGLAHPSVSNAGHIGGAIGGVLIAAVFGVSEIQRLATLARQDEAIHAAEREERTFRRPSQAELDDPENRRILRPSFQQRLRVIALALAFFALVGVTLSVAVRGPLAVAFAVLLVLTAVVFIRATIATALVFTPAGIELVGLGHRRFRWVDMEPTFEVQTIGGGYFVAFKPRPTLESTRRGIGSVLHGGKRLIPVNYGITPLEQARLMAEWYLRWTHGRP